MHVIYGCVRLTQVYLQFAQLLSSVHLTDYHLLHSASLPTKQNKQFLFQLYSHFQYQKKNVYADLICKVLNYIEGNPPPRSKKQFKWLFF